MDIYITLVIEHSH